MLQTNIAQNMCGPNQCQRAMSVLLYFMGMEPKEKLILHNVAYKCFIIQESRVSPINKKTFVLLLHKILMTKKQLKIRVLHCQKKENKIRDQRTA